ncbi:tautomerase family protein [Larkinella insperata]|uniref:Tautomerase family protein n=1 Tax=Larkinella insperata TaxID=332158 RepID=A0ABW3QJ41_9BACT|nr:tautomerase family protein [Larkinella insperata]
MSQVKIYGVKEPLRAIRDRLSDVIHACVVEALHFPPNKRAHRFLYLEAEDFFMPEGRSEKYVIIEVLMMEGRTVETKKKLINLLFERISAQIGLSVNDIEICILESPAHNWGFRGKTGDEASLTYPINV